MVTTSCDTPMGALPSCPCTQASLSARACSTRFCATARCPKTTSDDLDSAITCERRRRSRLDRTRLRNQSLRRQERASFSGERCSLQIKVGKGLPWRSFRIINLWTKISKRLLVCPRACARSALQDARVRAPRQAADQRRRKWRSGAGAGAKDTVSGSKKTCISRDQKSAVSCIMPTVVCQDQILETNAAWRSNVECPD